METKYEFSNGTQKLIEKIVNDDNVMINHMILGKDDRLPVHYSDSNVYMIIVKGNLTIQLNDGETNVYTKGNIINIPYNTKMNVYNEKEDILEFFVIKSPNPRFYK